MSRAGRQERWKQGIGALCAFGAAFLPVPALADIGPLDAYYDKAGAPTAAVFSVDVLASVGGRCGFAPTGVPNGSIDAAQIDVADWSGQVAFMPQCTAQWRLAVSSLHGGLKADVSAAGLAGFTDKAPYDVTLHVVHDTGTVDSSCPVSQIDQALTASPCEFRGTASPDQGLRLPRSYNQSGSYIQASALAYPDATQPRLVAGTYTDTLVLTVSPAT